MTETYTETTVTSAPASPEDPILQASRVRKVYRSGAHGVVALDGINLRVGRGEFVAVMGPSGSGKTTLLNCLSGLDGIDAGIVTVEGQDIHALSDARRTAHRAARMGFVFQAFNLIPVLSAVENVELPLLLRRTKARVATRKAVATLERVGLGHRLHHRPAEMSGGEQQRVTVARALAADPALVWADEPTGALDTHTATSVLELLGELNADGLTVLVVTHDPVVGAGAQRLVRMADGRVVGDAPQTPAGFAAPAEG